jgi:hypothetical protein
MRLVLAGFLSPGRKVSVGRVRHEKSGRKGALGMELNRRKRGRKRGKRR